jgi:acetate kinase
MSDSLILVVNPGSASRKYALFADGKKIANIHFEFIDGHVTGKIKYSGQESPIVCDEPDLSSVARYVLPLLHEYKIIGETDNLSAVGIRVVAPSKTFMQDELVTDEIINALKAVQQKAPLHVGTALSEIEHLKTYFAGIPIIIVSDSAFHANKPDCAWSYGIDTELADKLDIKRYGYHGVSVGSVVKRLQDSDELLPKTIVCHIGSGSSITAVSDGKSVETTMGYTPLEGLMMSTRCGNIDPSAVVAIKHELNLEDNELESYLNKKCGLLGVSGSSDDIRQLLISEEQGDARASLALRLFVYRIQLAIGQMAASMNGVDCLVFTATIGERSFIIRERILEKLGYLGFENNTEVNNNTFEPAEITNVGISTSKPILVVSTDEATEIAYRAEEYIKA